MIDWSLYIDYGVKKMYKKNEILFRQGSNMDGFYYLEDGKVAVTILRSDGFERMIDIVFPGSLIGEQMIYGTPSFTTTTMMKNSTLYYFSKDTFNKLAEINPQISIEFSNSFIQKIRFLANIHAVLNAPAEVQVAHFLIVLRNKKRDGKINLTQTEISNYIGKSRVTIWKILKKWDEDGLVAMNKRGIIIKDEKAIRSKIVLL
ncbi:MAG TPA: Crp/Fnr family transcriptional regulator [Pseudogracilibacillus sp.]|nr:Crp/Fnr family transcriptional regulator [Pseudogracilibacillus sp.]